jgi:CII-binding regulator of phage lambda lysogenization HflD
MTFLDVIEREKEKVITKYKTLNEKLQQKMDFKDPFTIFELYNSTVQLENNTSKKDSHILQLDEELKQLKMQNEELKITSAMTI